MLRPYQIIIIIINKKQTTKQKTDTNSPRKKKFPLVYRCLKWKNNEVICKFRWVELTRLEVEFLQKEKKTKKANQAKKKKKKRRRIWVNNRWSCRCLADKSTASPVPLQHVDRRGREQTMRHRATVKATYKETVCVLPSLISAHYLCLSEDLWVRLLRKRWNAQRWNSCS